MELANKCVICLSGRGDMNDIFGEFDQGYRIVDILKSTLNIEESSFESYEESPLMCETCIGIIVPFFYLKELYEKNREFVSDVKDVEQVGEPVKQNSTKPLQEVSIKPLQEDNIKQLHEDNIKPMQKPVKSYSRCNKRKEPEGLSESPNKVAKISSLSAKSSDKLIMPVKTKQIKVVKNSGLPNQAVKVLLTIVKDESVEEHFNKEDVFIIVNEDGSAETIDNSKKESSAKADPKYTAEEFRNYPCSFCPKEYFDLQRFKNHLKKVHSTDLANPTVTVAKMQVKKDAELELICDVCGQEYRDENEFRVHQETHKDYFCEICGMGFLKKSYLKDHKQIHDPDRFYKCDICDKSFQRRSVLTKHKRIHTNPREHICGECGRAFNEKGALITHFKLLHSQTKDFKCPICDCLFSLKSTLQKHIIRHNKERERAWRCNKCNLRYKDESSLNRHQKFKHSDYEVICGDCGKSFSTDSSLKRHGMTCAKRAKRNSGKNKSKTTSLRTASAKSKTVNTETKNKDVNVCEDDNADEENEKVEENRSSVILKKQNPNKIKKDSVKSKNVLNGSEAILNENNSDVDKQNGNSRQSKEGLHKNERDSNENDLKETKDDTKENEDDLSENERVSSQDTDELKEIETEVNKIKNDLNKGRHNSYPNSNIINDNTEDLRRSTDNIKGSKDGATEVKDGVKESKKYTEADDNLNTIANLVNKNKQDRKKSKNSDNVNKDDVKESKKGAGV